MKELNKEIKLTLNLMQTDSDGAREELQFHLYSLLDMKRDELQKHLPDSAVPLTVVNCSVSLVYEEPLGNGQIVQTLLGYLCNDSGKDEFDLKAEAERYHAKNNSQKIKGKKVAMWGITSLTEPKKQHEVEAGRT